jgi:putative copper export protein
MGGPERVLPVSATTIRLFLHILGATVWIGGQVTLGVLVPVLRPRGTEVLRAAARRFQLVAWPAFLLLLVTGVWNLFALHAADQSGPWLTTLLVKLGCVAVSGTAAAVHVLVAAPALRRAPDEASRRRYAALSGACEGLSFLFALAAAFLGVLISG